MDKQFKAWAAQDDLRMDSLGRIVIEDEKIISAINGAADISAYDLVNGDVCGCGCDD